MKLRRQLVAVVALGVAACAQVVTGSGSGNATKIQNVPVSAAAPSDGTCLVYSSSTGKWQASSCAGTASTAWSALTSGTNTAAAMVVGAGASLAATTTGTIAATSVGNTSTTDAESISIGGGQVTLSEQNGGSLYVAFPSSLFFKGPVAAFNGARNLPITVGVVISGPNQPTITGSAVSTQVGGESAGTFTSTAAAGAQTWTLTFTDTAPHGYACHGQNRTTHTAFSNLIFETSTTTTTAVLAGTTGTASDVIQFQCLAY